MAEVMAELAAKFPDEDWEARDGDEVLEQGALIADALRLGATPTLHYLYAQIVALERQAYGAHPYSVRDLFKYRGNGAYCTWDVVAKTWSTEDSREQLLNVICDVLGRRVREWGMEVPEEGCMVTQFADMSPRFLNAGLAESVEKLLRALLRDRDFQLDGDDMRR